MQQTYMPPFPLAKSLTSVSGGAVMTLAAFALMQYLVSQPDMPRTLLPDTVTVEIIKPQPDSKVKPIKRLPPQPEPHRPPIKPVDLEPGTANDPGITVHTTPKLSLDPIGGGDDWLRRPDGNATPLVRIPPKYPRNAARDGITGWVKLAFSISPTGDVTQPYVIDAEPRNTFDREALRAIKRWKYKPKMVNGQAISQPNQTVMLEFNLESNNQAGQ